MAANTFTLTIHMVQSLDGIIAKPDNSVSWFETQDSYEKGIEITPEAAAEFIKKIDCYVMGANTYLHALELSKNYGWVYGDIPTIVVTHRELPVERANVELYSGDLAVLVNEHLKPKYTNVWLVGGAMLSMAFIKAKLADELRLSVLPIILGQGLLFFDLLKQEQPLHLTNVNAYKSGMVELCYEVRR